MIRVLDSREPEWDQQLCHLSGDVYHTAAYHSVADANGEGKALLVIYSEAEKMLAWPHLLRDLSEFGLSGAYDVTSVYGYPGPVSNTAHSNSQFRERALRSIFSSWRQKGVVSVFTRFNPLLENHEVAQLGSTDQQGGDLTAPGIQYIGRSVIADLRLDATEILGNCDKNLRQAIRRGHREGLTASWDTEWSHLNGFLDMYHATMARNQAASYYYFRNDYVQSLRRHLGDRARLVILRKGDELAAAMIVLQHDDLLHAHLAGSSERYAFLSPLKVLIYGAAILGKELGASRFDLGGGRGGQEDPLFDFKRRFSPLHKKFHVGGWVLDQVRYERLCRLRGIDPTYQAVGANFFPEYRATSLEGVSAA